MKQEAYLREVEKCLHCPKDKRKQMIKELKADIDAALENGESWEEAERRMGPPGELAAEFNENTGMEQKPHSRVKKFLLILAAVVAGLAVLAAIAWWYLPKSYPMGTTGLFEEERVASEGIELVEMLNAGEYELVQSKAIDKMKPYLTEEQWEAVCDNLGGDLGAFQKFGSSIAVEVKQKGKHYAVTELVAVYENRSVTYQITFDSDMKLAGIYLR